MVGATLRDSGLWSREQRAEGCESGLYGATESPRREGSARPGKVKADFPEKGEVSQSLSGGTRIQWKAAEGSESILVHIAWIAHIGLGSVIELFFELWNVASAPGFATNCDKIRTSFAEWVISSYVEWRHIPTLLLIFSLGQYESWMILWIKQLFEKTA